MLSQGADPASREPALLRTHTGRAWLPGCGLDRRAATRTARAGLGGSNPGLCWQLATPQAPGTHRTDLLPLPVQLCLVIRLLEATGFASLRHLDPVLEGCPGEGAGQSSALTGHP